MMLKNDDSPEFDVVETGKQFILTIKEIKRVDGLEGISVKISNSGYNGYEIMGMLTSVIADYCNKQGRE